MDKDYLIGISLVLGTIIGAGVFGLPYVISKAGWLVGVLFLIIIGVINMLISLYAGEAGLRTKGFDQLVGLANTYLGKWAKYLQLVAVIIGVYGALIAYVIGVGSTMQSLFGGNLFIYQLIFFSVASFLVYTGIRSVGKSELIIMFVNLVFVFLLIALLTPRFDVNNLAYINLENSYLLFGPVLFAFLGYSIVPELERVFHGKKRRYFHKSIITASIISIIVYFLFSTTFIGVHGEDVKEVSVQTLTGINGLIGGMFLITAMTTSYIALGFVLQEIFNKDLKINKPTAWAMSCLIPFVIVLFSNIRFITAIGLSGGISGSITAILIALITYKAREKGDAKPTYVVPGGTKLLIFVGAVFFIGFILEVIALISLQ